MIDGGEQTVCRPLFGAHISNMEVSIDKFILIGGVKSSGEPLISIMHANSFIVL
jgi:hypothetical protein